MTTPLITGYQAPGVYRQDVFPPPAPGLLTGGPAFLGYAADGLPRPPQPLTLWPQFQAQFGAPRPDGFLASAVRGFFENGGPLCSLGGGGGPPAPPPGPPPGRPWPRWRQSTRPT